MTYKQLKRQNKVYKELYTHYKEMTDVAIGELHFEKLSKDNLNNLINEIEVLLDKKVSNKLIKQVIDNGKQRAVIDVSIHTDLLFK